MRKSFGGMNGDKKMLNFYIDYYYNKFKNITLYDKFNELNIIVEPVSTKMQIINVLEFHLESVDFHCCSTLVKNIKKTLMNFQKKILNYQYGIVLVESTVEKKKYMMKKYDYIWNNIKYLKYELSKKYLIYSKNNL